MSTLANKPVADAVDVKCTDDELIVTFVDGRRVSAHWLGSRDFFVRRAGKTFATPRKTSRAAPLLQSYEHKESLRGHCDRP